MPYEHDESQWPLIVCRTIGESTDEDIQAYITAHEAALARGRHVVVIDASAGKNMGHVHRRQIADWVRARSAALHERRAGLAFVSRSALVRGMLTATYWLTPPPYPTHIVSTLDEARKWALDQLGH
jgi:hypothetical protein